MIKEAKVLNKFTFIYFYIPTMIFILGWLRPILSVPLSILLTIVLIKVILKDKKKITIDRIYDYIRNNKEQIIFMLIISIIFVYLSGIGGLVYQNYDHAYRNAILNNLVNYDWPIIEKNGEIFFVYYFAYWLPAALMGKIFGLEFAYFFLFIWTIIGVYILFNYIKKISKGYPFIPIIIFIFFSGLDIAELFTYGGSITQVLTHATHIEWSTQFQFSSFTTQLFWVFNQALPAWLLTFYILSLKDNRIIGLLIAISLIFCTLPSFGLVFVAIYKIFFDNKIEKGKVKEWLKHTFTFENLIVGIPLLIIFGIFVKSNAAGGKVTFGISLDKNLQYLVATFFEFLIYYLCIYKYQKKSSLYYISLLSLLICPLVSINNGGDFCMRASIPGLIILYIFVIDTFYKAKEKNDKVTITLLIIILLIGSVTPSNEIRRTIMNTYHTHYRETAELITETSFEKNFYGYTKDNIFYKYLMKK